MPTDSNTDDALRDLRKTFEGLDRTINESPDVWLKLVRDKLYTMFRAPLKEEYRREAFKWVASLCMSIGDFSWLCPGDKWTDEEAKIFSFITRLSINEILILLPFIHRHLTCGEEVDREEGKVMARSADESEYDAFGDHLVILESAIKSLVKDQNEHEVTGGNNDLTDCIEPSELKNLLERLKEAIAEICDYLEVVHRYWSQLVAQMDSEKFTAFEGALRIMSVWLSEDPGSFEEQCERFVIDLIVKSLLLQDRPTLQDLLILALHSICSQNEVLIQTLKRTPYESALQNYLDYVQKEQDNNNEKSERRHHGKKFKLRCGLVKDLMTLTQH